MIYNAIILMDEFIRKVSWKKFYTLTNIGYVKTFMNHKIKSTYVRLI